MTHITEILPDLEDMPVWAREAFEAGQFFRVALERVEAVDENLLLTHIAWQKELKRTGKAEATIKAISELTRYNWNQSKQDYLPHNEGRCVSYEKLTALLKEKTMTNETDKPYMGKPDPRADTGKKHTQMLGGERVSYDCPACFDAGGFPQPCAVCGVIRAEVAAEKNESPLVLDLAKDEELPVPDNAWPLDNCPPETAGDRLQKEHTPNPAGFPRITTADIDMAIATARRVDYYRFPYTTVTVCCVELSNGFCVVGKAAAVSMQNFDMAIGRRVALEDVENKLWELLGFRLKQALFEGPVAKRHTDPEGLS